MGVLVQVEVITTTMECCIAYLCSLFSEVVHYRKSVKQRKPKAAIKGACHRFSKSVSVDGQKNADKNWSVQPYPSVISHIPNKCSKFLGRSGVGLAKSTLLFSSQ